MKFSFLCPLPLTFRRTRPFFVLIKRMRESLVVTMMQLGMTVLLINSMPVTFFPFENFPVRFRHSIFVKC